MRIHAERSPVSDDEEDTMAEVFVLIGAQNPAAARRHVADAGGRVVQSYGPNAMIIEADLKLVHRLRAISGIKGVYEGEVPADSPVALNEMERLGVAAWNERHRPSTREAKRRRVGDGESWDAPGFEAPDGDICVEERES